MSANSCPRCMKALPERTLRALTQGTTCPYCAAPLKRTPKRAPAAAPADDDGYASFEMSAAPPPAPSPAPAKAAPATTASSPKSFRATMVGGTAVAARSLPFEGTPAPAPISLSPPVPAPAPAPASTPPVRSGAAAALARTIAAPAPMRTPGARPSVAPAAGKPHRTLTPAQALDLPPPTPAPVLNTPSPIASISPHLASVGAQMIGSDTGPTRVSHLPGLPPEAVRPLVADSESGPTNVAQPTAPQPAAAEPLLKFPDSEPVIDSVTVAPEPERRPAPAVPILAPPAPRRGLAFVGVGMGLAIVVIAIVGFKLVSGSSRKVAAPAPTAAAPPAPVVEAVAPAAPEETAPPAKAAPAPKAKTKAKATPAPTARQSARRAAAERLAEKRAAAASRRRQHAAEKAQARKERRAAHARTVAAREIAPKRSSATAAPAEHADPRPPYEHGNALLFAGDGKGAIAAYREAVRSAPNDPIGFRGLGLAYEQQGEPAQAIKALRRYLKLAPNAADHDLISKRIDKLSKRAKTK